MNTIQDFTTDVFKSGLQRSHSFELEITLPVELTSTTKLDKLRIRSEFASVQTPPLTTTKVRHGNTFLKAPIEREFEQITIGFLPDSAIEQLHILSEWMNSIVSGHHITEVEYYDTYLGEIIIKLFDVKNTVTSTFKLYEAFPINVSAMDFNKTIRDDVARFSCAFIYSDMKVVKVSDDEDMQIGNGLKFTNDVPTSIVNQFNQSSGMGLSQELMNTIAVNNEVLNT